MEEDEVFLVETARPEETVGQERKRLNRNMEGGSCVDTCVGMSANVSKNSSCCIFLSIRVRKDVKMRRLLICPAALWLPPN